MTWVIDAADRKLFKRCRRAWDFHSRTRQNYEPIAPLPPFDLDRAIRDALAIYYFPGMWQWSRAIVQPLARKAFAKSVRQQRQRQKALTPEQERDWKDQVASGEEMLERYFQWAPTADRFSPVRVETEFLVNIPDPRNPDQDLVTFDGKAVQYRGRIDLLVIDEAKKYWLLTHRVGRGWSDLEQLFLHEQGVSFCWAWESFFLGMKIEGTLYNELRLELPAARRQRPSSPIARATDREFGMECNEWFRRARIPRSPTELQNLRRQIALEAMEMIAPDLRIYPNPSDENCSSCGYRPPCIAMNEGAEVGLILEQSFRKRLDPAETGRLGAASWSMGRGAAPPRLDGDDASLE
jgi:hypothetical protein